MALAPRVLGAGAWTEGRRGAARERCAKRTSAYRIMLGPKATETPM